ncbi:MAG TPA: MFS transporter [Candidatus Methylomirabilis sp.]|nr:MFS transporter [Candidatus Methylomirabilis sp.]
MEKDIIKGGKKNVFALGLVSFFTDISSEMLYPIIPIFLTTVLAAPMSIVGLIEGIAEITASILKVVSGWLSDKIGRRNVMVSGFLIFSLVYLGFALANEGYQVWILFAVYGFYMTMTEGVSKAFVVDMVPPEVGVSAPFLFGSAAALVAAVMMMALLPRHNLI